MTDEKLLQNILTVMSKNFDSINERLSELDSINKRLSELDSINKRLSELDSINKRLSELDSIKERLSELDSINKRLSNIELHLENVTDKNIKIIAEGHADLTRKLDDSLKINNEKELLLIRVSYLENEVGKLKEKVVQMT